MRKLFPLHNPPHKPPRVVAAIKNEVRKYLKRERRKALPEGADYWDFDCQVGPDRSSPSIVHLAEIIPAIDRAAAESWETIFIEILAKPQIRQPKSKASQSAG